jgi:NTE family protein
MSDNLRISGFVFESPLKPQDAGRLPAAGGKEEPAGPGFPEDTTSLTPGHEKKVAINPGRQPSRTGPPASARPASQKKAMPEKPAAFIFQDEFPEMIPGSAVDDTGRVLPAAGSIIDGIWERWCDSLNLSQSFKRILRKALKDVDRISGNHSRKGREKVDELSDGLNKYRKTCESSLLEIRSAAGKLSKSSNPALRKTGLSAIEMTKRIKPPLSNMREPLKDLEQSASDGWKAVHHGTELIKSGLSHIPDGGEKPLSRIHQGRAVLRQGLADNLKSAKNALPETMKSLEDISSAADDFLACSHEKHGSLSKEDKALFSAVTSSAKEISKEAVRLGRMGSELMDFFSKEPGSVASCIDQGLNTAWNSIARDPDNVPLEFTCIHRSTKEFIIAGNNFRSTLGAARKGDARAAALLEEKWGYTPDSVPPEGTLFIDPEYFPEEVKLGRLSSSQFPSGKPVEAPPSVESQLFKEGRSFFLRDEGGSVISTGGLDEYRNFISAHRRTALGRDDVAPEPRQVHLALRGGGGLGKRYPAALNELFRLGIVPSSLSGTSAGAMAAGFLAAGADPVFLEKMLRDERIARLYDVKLGGGGLLKGEVAYKLFDDTLRELTGIKDRPVTFADLKIPLHILAVKYADSSPPRGGEDLGLWENRMFVFGPETTPNTPVALAIRASIAIPGVFEPVEMVDPTTGRTLLLADGGVLDNLPIGYNRDNLPTVALNLGLQNRNHPDDILNRLPTRSIPKEQLYAGNPILNALYSGLLYAFSGRNERDYAERFNPPPGTFVFNIPTWNTEKPSEGDSQLNFAYDRKIDPILDGQTVERARNFFRTFFDSLSLPGACGTNLKPLPEKPEFTRELEFGGRRWKARYDGEGHSVAMTDESGKEYSLKLGKKTIETWLLDDSAYGDLNGRLIEAISSRRLRESEAKTFPKDDL